MRKIFPHVAITLSGMYIVFYFIDRVNPAMAFIDNGGTKILLLILGIVSVINASCILHDERKKALKRRQNLSRRTGMTKKAK